MDPALSDKAALPAAQTSAGPGMDTEKFSAAGLPPPASTDWLATILRTDLFLRIPPANLQKLLTIMEPVACKTGEVIICQGDPGDYYYIIKQGRCEVTRQTSQGAQSIRLTDLRPGDAFGADALISDTCRNASVHMLTDGELVRISKDDFLELIKKPLLKAVTHEQALELAEGGALWLDVRFPEEHRAGCIPGSLNIPLSILRVQLGKLDPVRQYIVYCDDGSRSSVAAFLLIDRGMDACYVAGGCRGHLSAPPAANQAGPTGVATATNPASARAEAPQSAAAAQKPPASEESATITPTSRPIMQTDTRPPAPRVEPAKKNMLPEQFMENVEKRLREERMKYENEARKVIELVHEVRRLRVELEAQKRAAVTEAETRRRDYEAASQRARTEVEQRFLAEQAKWEESYRRKVEELERAQALRAEAENSLLGLRQGMDLQSGEQQRLLDDARRQLQTQLEQEQRRHEATQTQVSELKRILDAEFARNAALVELARQERKASETARRAAAEEAEHIIAEYRARHERMRARQEELMREERRLLEMEREHMKTALQEAQRSREQAEAVLRRAEEQASRLRAQQRSQIDTIEADAAAAARQLRDSVRTQERSQQDEERANREMLERTYDYQNLLRKQLQKELDDWMGRHEPGSIPPARILDMQRENIEKIQKKAEEVRMKAANVEIDFDLTKADTHAVAVPAPDRSQQNR